MRQTGHRSVVMVQRYIRCIEGRCHPHPGNPGHLALSTRQGKLDEDDGTVRQGSMARTQDRADGKRWGRDREARAFVADTKLDPKMVIIDVGGATADRLGVAFNPGAVTVLGGRLGHAAIVNSVEQIHALIGEERRSEGGELAVRPLGVGPEAFAREVTP